MWIEVNFTDFSTFGEELANNFYIRSALRGGNADF